MPNHVINEITIHDVPLELVRPLALNAEGNIDFSVLLPLPINHWPGSVGIRHQEAFPGNHLEDARRTWGTKWNAYGIDEGYSSVRQVDRSSVLTFQTAWSHPRGWVCALWSTLKCRLTCCSLSEGAADGSIDIYDWSKLEDMFGEAWTQNVILDGTPEHRRMHKLLWGVEEFSDEETA